MNRHIKSAVLAASLAVLGGSATSASAQSVVADLGPLHIRVVDDAPPPIRYERRPVRPARDYVWVGGYWDRRGNSWDWVSGRWDRPSDRRYKWVRPRYVREGRHTRYEPGHWSNERLNDEEYRRWRRDRRD